MSQNGRAFYGIRQNEDKVQYVKRSNPIKAIKDIKTNEGKITVFNPYSELYWEKAN